jgi:hypothetical protein
VSDYTGRMDENRIEEMDKGKWLGTWNVLRFRRIRRIGSGIRCHPDIKMCPFSKGSKCELHNQTMTITMFLEK